MKKLIILIGFLSMLSLTGCNINGDLQGEGNESSPYLIKTAGDLIKFSSYINEGNEKYMNAHIKLTSDINMGNAKMRPIGGLDFHYFNGVFDGDNHSINNFKPHDNYKMQALFGENGKDCIIKNLTINVNVNTKTSSAQAGGIVSHNSYGALIENCHVRGSINCSTLHKTPISTDARFIDKYAKEKKVYDQDNKLTGEVTLTYYLKNKAGGIAGCNYGTIKNCTASTSISADIAGGIAGTNAGDIIGCESLDSNLYSTSSTGGIVGFSNFISHLDDKCHIVNCSSKNHILSGDNYIGGLVGTVSGKISVNHSQNYGVIIDNNPEQTVIGDIIGRVVYQIGQHKSNTSIDIPYVLMNLSLNVNNFNDCLSLNSYQLDTVEEQKTTLYYPIGRSNSFSKLVTSNLIAQGDIKKKTESTINIGYDKKYSSLYLKDSVEIEELEGRQNLSDLNKNIIQEAFNADINNIEQIQVDDVTGYVFKTMNF